MTQPESLRQADYFDYHGFFDSDRKVATELRRLHEENKALRDALHTIVIHSASVQMEPQWAVQVARNAINRVKGESK